MAKIKLLGTFGDYNGQVGQTVFVDGESVASVTPAQIRLISAAMRCEVLAEEGETVDLSDHGVAQALIDGNGKEAAAQPPRMRGDEYERLLEAQKTEESELVRNQIAAVTGNPVVVPEVDDAPEVREFTDWTAESLGEVADKDGIAGLRELADPKGIKSNSIAGLIAEMLQYQG